MLKPIATAGLTASAVITVTAAVLGGQPSKNLAVLGGVTGVGSAVAALLAGKATESKYSQVIDAEAEG